MISASTSPPTPTAMSTSAAWCVVCQSSDSARLAASQLSRPPSTTATNAGDRDQRFKPSPSCVCSASRRTTYAPATVGAMRVPHARHARTRSVRGTYVITPEMLLGQEQLEFVGRSPEYRETTPQIASAPEAW